MTAVTRNRSVVLVAGAALVAAITWVTTRTGPPPRVDLTVSPPTVFATVPFEVGATYTLGEARVPPEVKRPVVVSAVEVVHAHGIEVLGVGVYEPSADAIGLVPGWPPRPPYESAYQDPSRSLPWAGAVHTVVGIRTIEPKSGLRGIEVRWVDGHGLAGARTFDLAVVTCAPGACTVDTGDAALLLRELGLLR